MASQRERGAARLCSVPGHLPCLRMLVISGLVDFSTSWPSQFGIVIAPSNLADLVPLTN